MYFVRFVCESGRIMSAKCTPLRTTQKALFAFRGWKRLGGVVLRRIHVHYVHYMLQLDRQSRIKQNTILMRASALCDCHENTQLMAYARDDLRQVKSHCILINVSTRKTINASSRQRA